MLWLFFGMCLTWSPCRNEMCFVLYLITWSFCNLLKCCLHINQVAKAHSSYLWDHITCFLTCLFLGTVGTLVLFFPPKRIPELLLDFCLFSALVSCVVICIICLERPVARSRAPLISRNHCYSSESVYRPCCKTWECSRITRDSATRNLFPELLGTSSLLLQLLC